MFRRLVALAITATVAPNILLLCLTGLGGGHRTPGGDGHFGLASINCHQTANGIYYGESPRDVQRHCGSGHHPDGPGPTSPVGTWSSGAKGSFRLPVASAATYRGAVGKPSSHSSAAATATVLGATVLAAGGGGLGVSAASSTRRSMDASDNRTPTTLDAMRLNYGADAPPETLKVSKES